MQSAKRKKLTAGLSLGLSLLLSSAVTVAQSAECEYHVDNDWGSGHVGSIRIHNTGDTPIQGWQVQWQYDNNSLTNSWNAQVSGNNPYTATDMGWNGTIQPGQSAEFGFQVSGGAGSTPAVTGEVCEGDGSDSGASSSSVSSAASSVSVSSAAASSEAQSSSEPASSAPASSAPASSSASSAASSAPHTGYDPIQGGCDGYATRFWDCCKPHCGWSENLPGGVEPMGSCSAADQPLNNPDAISSCEGGDAHVCHGMVPFAVSDDLAFGYAATSSGDICGRCFQLEFTGDSYNAGNDPGSAALGGKTMIVQAVNIGYDVAGGQMDIMVPGGGVGAFDGCSNQWGVSNQDLGAQYGGFLSACKDELGYNASLEQYKSCVTNRCDSVFGSRGLDELQAGCHWFADWFEAADNPALRYQEVQCPAELKAGSGMDRSALGDISNSCGGY